MKHLRIQCAFGKHDWDGCTCRTCQKHRDQGHHWNTTHCECYYCSLEDHEWELVESEETVTDVHDGYFLNGFGQCGPEYETVHYIRTYRCKKCAKDRQETGTFDRE